MLSCLNELRRLIYSLLKKKKSLLVKAAKPPLVA